jgi:DNA-3-methyladenine glycosylase I
LTGTVAARRNKTGGVRKRCAWAGEHPPMIEYHDLEWGVPARDCRHLFEMLVLEGAQAGLSWRTILDKRAGYKRLFSDFEIERVARFTPARVEKLLADPAIVRNRLKVESTVANAKAILALEKDGADFVDLLWSFTAGLQKPSRYRRYTDLPAETAESRAMSRTLKKLGFRFVGPTVCYSFMQAVGMVNDHEVSCFRYDEVAKSAGSQRKRSSGTRGS